jgi:hypothetical protein
LHKISGWIDCQGTISQTLWSKGKILWHTLFGTSTTNSTDSQKQQIHPSMISKNLLTQVTCKMLMKFAPIYFTNVLRTAFTYVSFTHSFFVLSLYFTGTRLLAQKLPVKCWWNWPQEASFGNLACWHFSANAYIVDR